MLPVSLNFPFLIAPSVLSYVYILAIDSWFYLDYYSVYKFKVIVVSHLNKVQYLYVRLKFSETRNSFVF